MIFVLSLSFLFSFSFIEEEDDDDEKEEDEEEEEDDCEAGVSIIGLIWSTLQSMLNSNWIDCFSGNVVISFNKAKMAETHGCFSVNTLDNCVA